MSLMPIGEMGSGWVECSECHCFFDPLSFIGMPLPAVCDDCLDDTTYNDEFDAAEELDMFGGPGYVFSPVGEIYIDFDDGEISGNCDGCTGEEVAWALERVARRLRDMGGTPSYIGFDEGKLCGN